MTGGVVAILAITTMFWFSNARRTAAHEEGAASPSGVAPLLTQALGDPDKWEVNIMSVGYKPGGSTPPHRHPAHVFVYVAEGQIESQVGENAKVITYKTGDVFYEHPNALHAVSRNPSETDSAKIIVFYVKENGRPLISFGPAPSGDSD